MNKKITFFLFNKLLLLFFFFLIIGFAFYASAEDNIYKDNEFLIKYKGEKNIVKVNIKAGNNLFDILKNYNNNPLVEYVEPNFLFHASILPSDKYFNNQWYLKKINAADAWDAVNKTPNVTIALIDSGVLLSHPDLKGNIWINAKEIPNNGVDDDKNGFIDDINGWDFVNNTANPEPKFKKGYTAEGMMHGTIIAGIIGAVGNNNTGITGITWNVKIMPIKVLDDSGEGDTINVVRAIDYAINNGADIINFSFVGQGQSQSLNAAIKRAYESKIIIVAAAGNEQSGGQGTSLDSSPMYPVCNDGQNSENMIIGVAATDPIDQKASFSSYGFKCVDLAAPGVSIFSTSLYSSEHFSENNSFKSYYDGYWSGTSMAAPMVTGTLALISEINPSLKKQDIIRLLLANTDNINRLNPNYLSQLGTGRLNVFKAVMAAKNELTKYQNKLVIAPYENSQSIIKIMDKSANIDSNFIAYDEKFLGGVRIAAGDINGDNIDEIITGPGPGGGPHIKVFDSKGNLQNQFFAYNKNFRGGVNVSAGDIDGDGIDEIITGPGAGGGPHVKVFDQQGNLQNQFFAYNKNFRGGVNVSAGDIDGDGIDEIITGPGAGGGPHVKVFDQQGNLQNQFFAYNKNFRGGVNVSAGNFIGGIRSPQLEIITSPQKGGGPHIVIYNQHGQILKQFFSFDKKFKGGVNLSAADLDNDGTDEVICTAGPGGSPHLRIFEKDGVLTGSFYAGPENFSGGISVSTLTINN